MGQDTKHQQTESRTTMSISMTVEDKKLLKMYAAEKNVTAAAIIHDWIQNHCKKGEK